MAITITHLDGPLAGKVEHFDDGQQTILFGRSREDAQVVFPPESGVVGVKHFQLRREAAGDYSVELFGKHFVSMDGSPILDGTVVKSGSTFRLGNKNGPSFRLDIESGAHAGYAKTEQQAEMLDAGERVGRLGRRVAYAFVALLALLGAGLGYSEYRKGQVIDHLVQNVYLVARCDSGEPKPAEACARQVAEATAFAIGPDVLATNAHVTEQIRTRPPHSFFLIGPAGDRLEIAGAESHPGYNAFQSKKQTIGTASEEGFKPMSLPSGYDVGIIKLEPSAQLPGDPLELASAEEVQEIESGMDVVAAGFPSEGIIAANNATKGAAATFHKGSVGAVKDIFQMATSDPANRLIVQHDIPVAGGMSGSPLVDAWSGKVIAIISGGNVVDLTPRGAGASETLNEKQRTSHGAQVNFSQRIDVLRDLIDGNAYAALARDEQGYWNDAAAKFDTYFATALDRFVRHGAETYGKGEEIARAFGTLIPGSGVAPAEWIKTPFNADADARTLGLDEATLKAAANPAWTAKRYELKGDAGYVYGFILDTTDALPLGFKKTNPYGSRISVRVKQEGGPLGATTKSGPAAAAPELALATWTKVTSDAPLTIEVGGIIKEPVRFTLHVYRWPEQAAAPASGSGSEASMQSR